ncbi:MAG TPA: hypothetical protein VGS41_09410, partial [Chthonomonadales bacterium]|nr:hypothetical protein [Chthonomonadales bacterium]
RHKALILLVYSVTWLSTLGFAAASTRACSLPALAPLPWFSSRRSGVLPHSIGTRIDTPPQLLHQPVSLLASHSGAAAVPVYEERNNRTALGGAVRRVPALPEERRCE